MVKKTGIFLIIIGFTLPLILLMFFGDNWVPAKQVGIIYSIMNSELKLFSYEVESDNENGATTWGDLEKNKESNDRFAYLDVTKDKIASIPFRYVAGTGLIFIILGTSIIIKELTL
jgi:hypothetical protein